MAQGMTGVPRVLIDSCVRKRGALIGREIDEWHGASWGDRHVGWFVRRLQARRLGRNEHWLRGQIPFISSVTAAMRAGRLGAYTSNELRFEGADIARGRGKRGDLWAGIPFARVKSPLERSTWMGSLTIDEVFSGKHQQEFCERLVHYAKEGVPPGMLEVLELDDYQRANLARLGEFDLLCKAVGPTRYRDAFHLWTAVCGGLDYFLTTDRKFLRVLRRHCGRDDLARLAVSPFELAKALDLPFEPPPVFEGEVIPYPFD